MKEIPSLYASEYKLHNKKTTYFEKSDRNRYYFFNETEKEYVCCCKFCGYSNVESLKDRMGF